MVPIDNEFVESLIDIGKALNQNAIRHGVDRLKIEVEPELGAVTVRGYNERDEQLFAGDYFGVLDSTEIKIAPQGTAIPTGASK